MDKHQKTPTAVPSQPVPDMPPTSPQVSAYIDEPRDYATYYFNPLAKEWQNFRELQVEQYLQYFNNIVAQSCLSDTPRYTHQFVPQFNPGWDDRKYAVNASLQVHPNLQIGVSLYGEASYGRSFTDWYKKREIPTMALPNFILHKL